jgi:hypothetical protein
MGNIHGAASKQAARIGRLMTGKNTQKQNMSPLLVIFFLILITPVTLYIDIAESKIDPYRLFILITSPLIIAAVVRNFSQFRAYDYFIFGYLLWSILCLYLRDNSIATISLHAVETFFAFALARFFVRDIRDFAAISKWALVVVAISVPIAAAESIYREHFITQFGSALTGQSYGFADVERYRVRWNLGRATTFFSHPIHFGLFCATVLPLAWYGKKSFRTFKVVATAAGAFFSLSSAAWLGWAMNAVLIFAEQVSRKIKGRGLMVAGALFSAGLAIQVFSKSGFFSVVVRYMAFDSFTAGNRIRIWDYGLQTMYAYPIFGIKPSEWLRLPWMTPSLDNHWILTGVEFGFPGLHFSTTRVCGSDFSAPAY